MGLTGSGKSTFIQKATGYPSIETGVSLESITTEVSSYSLVHKGREVFLIDSPGFDDDKLSSDNVLQKIADFVNGVQKLGWTISGIIYLHDTTRERMGAEGEMNLRLLKRLTGKDNWNNITLITTKWGISGRPEAEKRREQELKEKTKYWGDICNANRPARVCRFDNTEAGAKKVIEQYLNIAFVPMISQQMVKHHAALGGTNAGQMLQRMGRWAVRLATYGGGLVAAVVTENLMAIKAAIKIAGPLEMTFWQMKLKTEGRGADLKDHIANIALYGSLLSSGRITGVEDEEEEKEEEKEEKD